MKLRKLLLTLFFTVALSSCSSAAEKSEVQLTTPRKGAQQAMKTYYMGRFAVDVPAEFKLVMQTHQFRLIEIEEYPEVRATGEKWREHLVKIEKKRKPGGVSKIIIKEQNLEGMGQWARGVLYYSDSMSDEECNWDVFVSYGSNEVIFSLKGLLDKQQSMFAWLQEVARAYRPNSDKIQPRNGQFHTEYGVIDLPYKRQENTYARFEGPMEMVLRIEMEETHKVEEAGVMDRLAASLATNFAPGVDVDKIKTGKRTVAGLPGQEIVTRLGDVNGKELFGDGTVPESSARALKLREDKQRTFCIADLLELEAAFVDAKAKRLKPKCKVDFDEGYFDRGHEPIFRTKSAHFITITAIENICRNEIRRVLQKG
jgi:hypothetical protein